MELDRAYQRELLALLAQSYPQAFDIRQIAREWDEGTEQRYVANMQYLDEHGLAESAIRYGLDGHVAMGLPRITAKGMDFLADDGGLSAILGIVTIKIHDETLRQLIGQHIERMPGNEADKSRLRKALEGLTASASKAMLDRLIGLGVEHLPTTVESLHMWIQAVTR